MANQNKNVYISTVQACDLFDHMFKGKKVKRNYTGMIPYSLELVKLQQEGLKTFDDMLGNKLISNDIINVKFNVSVKSAREQIEELHNKVSMQRDAILELRFEQQTVNKKRYKKIDKDIDAKLQYIKHLEERIELMENEQNEPHMQGMNREELRDYIYENGFSLNGKDDYVVYKRSSAKSRKGECTFIKKKLYKKMIKWSRMGLDFTKQGEIDYPSLLAYESLVLSSIMQEDNGLLEIKPENMLIVDDIDSTFKEEVNVVRKGENGYLESVTEYANVTNSIFDGESLLDSTYFEDDSTKGMKLLRNHFFKSCAFNTNIQAFLEDYHNKYHNENEEFGEWYIKDMFDNEVKASDVKFIFTPTSLKALKFSQLIGEEKEMYEYWKNLIEKEGSIFGVCKQDKESQLGYDKNNNILQQTSYQFLNSLPLNDDQLEDLLTFEKEHIHKLKNDPDYFINNLSEKADKTNSYEMFVELYNHNPDIVHTKLFRDFRAKTINQYVEYVKGGKVRVPKADYTTICSNPIELLYWSVGAFDIHNEEHRKNIALKGNEVYCPMFEDDRELVCWRNPHTSQSNVLISKQRNNEEIMKYINASNNIVIVNSIDHPIQPILSGQDMDGDTMALVDNETLLSAAKECYGNYKVSVNEVPTSKKKYEVTSNNMAVIDNNLAKSSLWIGEVVNQNQHILSLYWECKANGASDKVLNHLIEQIDKFTILSEISIDLAKKSVDIDVNAQIDYIKSLVEYQVKEGKVQFPLFFKHVKKNGKIPTTYHDTTMDRLHIKMSDLEMANKLEDIPFDDLLHKCDKNKGNREQRAKIIDITMKKLADVRRINQLKIDKEEKIERLRDSVAYYKDRTKNLKITQETMYTLLLEVMDQDNGVKSSLLNILYNHDKEVFLNSFKNGEKVHGEHNEIT